MPKTQTKQPKPDLKALDEHQRRRFCKDGHRIAWPSEAERTGDNFNNHSRRGGLCSGGDYWSMKRVGYGVGARWQLEHEGTARWTRTGQFRLAREHWYATGSHEVGTKVELDLNCSHSHFAPSNRLALGRDEARRRTIATYPEVVQQLQLSGTDAATMELVIRHLTEVGWDFVTDDRIRCKLCIQEEAELDAKLAELARQDAGDPVVTFTDQAAERTIRHSEHDPSIQHADCMECFPDRPAAPAGWDETATGQTDQPEAGKTVVSHDAPWSVEQTAVDRPTMAAARVAALDRIEARLDREEGVTYEADSTSGFTQASYEGTEIATYAIAADGSAHVSYGRLRDRRFPSEADAKTWIEDQAGDLADLDVADEL